MLSWKMMEATEAACRHVCEQEQANEHYGDPFTHWARWCAWTQGFVAGWTGDLQFVPLSERISMWFRSLTTRGQRADEVQPDR